MASKNMQKKALKIGIIGVGNMGSAIYKSLSSNSAFSLAAYDKNLSPDLRSKLKVSASVRDLIASSNFIVLAVKPQDFPALALEISKNILKGKVFISIMAGVSIKKISNLLKSKKIIRTMPNLPLKAGKGVTGWFAAPAITKLEKKQAQAIISDWGLQFELKKEGLINAVTAVSGSGPAYFYYLCECLASAGEKLGLPEKIAEPMAAQTLIGSAALLAESPLTIKKLREAITSKGGTTLAALNSFKKNSLGRIVTNAVRKAHKRALQLSN